MQVIIPMAGLGERFKNAGYREPKPLIKVHGKYMIEHVVNLFDKEDSFLFICNTEHVQETNLKEVLQGLGVKAKIIEIKHERLGPVWGILQATEHIDLDAPTIVTYCDFNMCWDYEDFKKNVLREDTLGAVVSYTGFHPHLIGPNKYAGVKVGKNNIIEEVKEKHSYTEDKMESWHSNGVYYFKTGAVLIKYFKELLDSKSAHDNGEYYVSQVYNKMIEDGGKVVLYPISHFCQWGTPEDLEQFEAWQKNIGDKKILAYWKEFDTKNKKS